MIGVGISITSLATRVSSAITSFLRSFFTSVKTDGGTAADQKHTEDVYTDTLPYTPLLIQTCDTGKATVLYSLFAFSDVNTYEARVTADSGTTASTDHVIAVAHGLWNVNLFTDSTIIVPCASGKATVLYSLIPN